MWVDALFTIASALAASAWLVLLSGDRWPGLQATWSGLVVPLLLAVAYAVVFPALYLNAPGGYGSIDAVLTLLTSDRRIVLAAWLHYLAFDLLVGGYIVIESRNLNIRPLARVPALVLTFLFGPAGWLWFRIQAAITRRSRA